MASAPYSSNSYANKTIERGPIIKLARFTMWASVAGQERRAQLVWSVQDGNPRLSVFYNNPDIQKPANASFGLDTMLMVFDAMKRIAAGPFGKTEVVENFINDRDENGKVIGKKKISELYYGKDAEGTVWLGIKDITYPKPSVKFAFIMSDFHNLMRKDGDTSHPMSKSEASERMAICTIDGLRETYLRMATPVDKGASATTSYDDEPPPAAATPAAPIKTNTSKYDDFANDIPM